jgi:hypothetical protein
MQTKFPHVFENRNLPAVIADGAEGGNLLPMGQIASSQKTLLAMTLVSFLVSLQGDAIRNFPVRTLRRIFDKTPSLFKC